MKFKIFTAAVNNPFFLEVQSKNFKKFLDCDYEFCVIDDAKHQETSELFYKIAEDNGVIYVSFPERNKHIGSHSTDRVIQWTYENYIKTECSDDLVLFLDSDLFLIDKFDPYEFMKDSTIAALMQNRGHVNYIWNGIMFFNMEKILKLKGDLDFNLGNIEGHACDSGGHTYYFIKENKIEVKDVQQVYNGFCKGYELENMETFIEGKFLHFRGGTLWDGKVDVYERKLKILQNILSTI
jgi:hypothetical protein